MPIDHDFEALAARLGARAEKVAQAIGLEVERAFDRAGERWKAAMTGRVRGPLVLSGAKSRGEDLATRSGALGAGFYYRRDPGGGARSRMVLGNSAAHARVHEYGTVGAGGELPDIVPVTARALTIPLEDAMTPSGMPKEPSARDWPDTFLWYGEDKGDGLGYIVREDPDDAGELQFLYKLVDRVAIPPRLGMRSTFAQQFPELDRELVAAIERAAAL